MKKTIAFSATFLTLLVSTAILAQPARAGQGMAPEQRSEHDARNDRRIERRAARIADRLDLTPDQEATLRTVMAEKRDNPDWTPNEASQQLSGVLTDVQLAELDEMRSYRGRYSRGGCKK